MCIHCHGRAAVGVVVRELREVIVGRMGVPASAIGTLLGERHVVVPRQSPHPELVEKGKDLSRIRAEPAEITEAEEALCSTAARVLGRRAERNVVAVDAPQEGDRTLQIGLEKPERHKRRLARALACEEAARCVMLPCPRKLVWDWERMKRT